MPVTSPPEVALKHFLAPTTRHTRRIEIYEQDGVTRWAGDVQQRLKGGQVTVDYDREERRALDLSLSNADGEMINAPGKLWYDKVIKVFRGVQVRESNRLPKVLVISDSTTLPLAADFREVLVDLGFGDVRINPLAVDYYEDILPYDVIVGLGGANKSPLMVQAYLSGKGVINMGDSAWHFISQRWGAGAVANQVQVPTIAPQAITHPMALGWTAFAAQVANNSQMLQPTPAFLSSNTEYKAISTTVRALGVSEAPTGGGKAVFMNWQPADANLFDSVQFNNFLLTAMNWLNPVRIIDQWEVQIGEFMIDRISEPNFPHDIKITGRDYTKKCMMSKYSQATQFAAGQTLEALIGSIAGAAGITKRLLPATGIVIGQDFFFERNVSRWNAMKQIANAYNYEIFFDATGYLIIRPYRDPATSVPVIYLKTGVEGQLGSYEKSTSDSSLFNHILVTGESSNSDTIPVWAEAKNTNPDSPTSIAELGDRYWEYTNAFITTTAQAQELADTYLAIMSLEEFELSFSSLMLPWLEVGDIIGWIDPNPAPGDPSTFLLASLSLPLTLGPMSGTGRRVTIVS